MNEWMNDDVDAAAAADDDDKIIIIMVYYVNLKWSTIEHIFIIIVPFIMTLLIDVSLSSYLIKEIGIIDS